MNDAINRKDTIGAILSIEHIAELSDGDAVIRVSAVNYVLRNLPSADVMPVVRCKDCRHRYLDKKYGFRCDLDTGDPFEEARSAENDDWFCADGIKMNGEQND